jgi:hypothetical protein
MPERDLPVRPNLRQLGQEAVELLAAIRRGDPVALVEFRRHHPGHVAPDLAELVDAELVLARTFGVPSFERLEVACRMTDAIWRDDVEAVRELVAQDPGLLQEDARGVKGNWGPPMSYAANLGRDRIVAMLHARGAQDLEFAFDRACLQGRLETARLLHGMGARPRPGAVMGPCETQSGKGLALLLELGAKFEDAAGDRLAPVALILQTYCRNPAGKHLCLELAERFGVALPDSPTLAVHRGRVDLLEAHWRRDPTVVTRTYSHEEIFPPELGCHADRSLALHGTPVAGGTLLHLCVEYDEVELAQWLLAHGADVNGRAAVDADGFGGHTALFACVVSQTFVAGPRRDDAFARLLLDAGADPNVRASLRKRLRFVKDETMHEYRDVTPIAWGERFHGREWVNAAAMKLIAERGGKP